MIDIYGVASRKSRQIETGVETVLIVTEDDDFIGNLRLYFLMRNARIRRATCVRSVRRHLAFYKPRRMLIDPLHPEYDEIEKVWLTQRSAT